jgi:anti-sigma B factor antagonist
MQTQFEPKVTRNGVEARLAPRCDITAANVAELRGVMKSLLGEGIQKMVFDLEDVKVIDSSGIGLLVAAFNSLSRQGGNLEVVNASADLINLLIAFRLDRHFPIHGAVE